MQNHLEGCEYDRQPCENCGQLLQGQEVNDSICYRLVPRTLHVQFIVTCSMYGKLGVELAKYLFIVTLFGCDVYS